MKKLLSAVLSLVMVVSTLFVAPFNALAAVSDPGTLDSTALEFWADPENTITEDDITAYKSGDKTTMVGAVAVHKRSTSESGYYLFLPSNADCNNLKLWFTASNASVNGTALTSGAASDVFKDIDGGSAAKSYTLKLDDKTYSVTVIKSGDVGTVYIDTESGSIAKVNNSADKSQAESGTILVTESDGKVDFDGALNSIKGRGNATWTAKGTKNPYNIKIAKKTSLFGMAKSKKWCLIANAGDDTLIKNQLTYDFAEYIGVKCQVIGKPVDLYVNQQYLGSYLLTEKVEIGTGRVEVSDAYENLEEKNAYTDPVTGDEITDLDGTPTAIYGDEDGGSAPGSYSSQTVGVRKYSSSLTSPDDITGGYLYELEISNRWQDEGAGFCGYNRQGWVIKSCDYASRDMVNYSYDLFYALGGSVYNGGTVPDKEVVTFCSGLKDLSEFRYGSRTATNPAPKAEYQGKKWSELLDSDSAVRYYWTQEYFKNMDSSTSSTYFFKESDSIDSKLYAGPMWDMDESLGYNKDGSRWGYSYTSPDGWYTKNTRIYRWRADDSTMDYDSDSKSPRTFYGALATNCKDFWSLAIKSWRDVVEPATRILIGKEEDSTGTLHSVDYYAEKIAKSGNMNNIRHDAGSDYDAAAIAAGLKNWLSVRAEWITKETHIHTPAPAVKEKVSASGYDEVVYCTECKAQISRKTVNISSPDGFAPSKAEADAVAENGSIVKIDASKINTYADTKKKTLRVDFTTVKGATNYRLRYRKAGASAWTYVWTGGKGSYTIKNLTKNGLYQLQIAAYVYGGGKWTRSKYSNVSYRYMTKLTGVKAASKKNKKVKVSWSANKNATGYEVAYAKKKGTKKTVKTVKGAKKKAYTIKFKKKGTYYVFVRSYKIKGGKKYTSQWTTKKVKVK